jgi:hypothetical protein
LAEEEGEFAAGGKANFSGRKSRTDFLGPKNWAKNLAEKGLKSKAKKAGRFCWVVRNF